MDRFMLRPNGYRSICAQCRTRLFPSRIPLRHLSTTTPNLADHPDPQSETQIDAPDATTDAAASVQQPTDQSASPSISSTTPAPDPLLRPGRPQFLESITQASANNNFTRSTSASSSNSRLASIFDTAKARTPPPLSSFDDTPRLLTDAPQLPPPYHLHVYATKHNTHITLTNPVRDPIISVSCGNIGFRKAARGTYDAAYQLGAYVMGRIQQQGLLTQIQHLEVVLRDFGPGREAVSKILLGSEGRNLRGRVVRVCDSTRLKFGGTRSKKPRRL
ncbi:MAG: hypothetical protein Q9223_002905 [Gallowayella weberi]